MIEIEGIEEVLRELKKNADPEKLYQQMGKACAVVERAAKQKAPKGVGDLQRSIQFRVEVNGDEIVGVVFTPLEYAPYVEYGTYKMAARPFLRPAYNKNVNKLTQELKRILGGK